MNQLVDMTSKLSQSWTSHNNSQITSQSQTHPKYPNSYSQLVTQAYQGWHLWHKFILKKSSFQA